MRFRARAAIVAALCLPATAAPPAIADVFNGRIAFTTNRVDYDPGPGLQRDRDIFSINPDGTDLQQLTTDPANDAQADWAPDGTAIVYRIRKPNQRINFEVARMPAGGGERQSTTSPAGQASSQPSWFPNLQGILFRVSSGPQADIWKMGPFGASPRAAVRTGGQPVVSELLAGHAQGPIRYDPVADRGQRPRHLHR